MPKKHIELTDAQYKTLIKLAFLGEWVLNAHNVESKYPKEQQVLNHLLSKFKTFNAEELVHEVDEDEDYEVEDEVVMGYLEQLIEFREDTFWELLVNKLVGRDLIEILLAKDPEALKNFSEEEREAMIYKLEKFYKKEFDTAGLETLRVVNDDNVDPRLN